MTRKNNRRRCRSYPVAKFTDPTTGAFCRINNTPWYLKNLDHIPGYFLQMDDQMREMTEDCFKATAARSSEFDFTGGQKQIDQFMQEAKNENQQIQSS
jgi:hypothetical protein